MYKWSRKCVDKQLLTICGRQGNTSLRNDSTRPKIMPNCCVKPIDMMKKGPLHTLLEKNVPMPSVLVVGGGVAGLSAAVKLVEQGITNVRVLEAQSCIGGRIHTCNFAGTRIDLGAYKIRGASVANPIYNFAVMEGVISPKRVGLKRKTDQEYYLTQSGKTLAHTVEATNLLNAILAEAATVFVQSDANESSLKDFILKKINEDLKGFSNDQKIKIQQIISGLLSHLRQRLGTRVRDIGLKSFGSTVQIPGGDYRLEGGASGLLQPLLNKVPAEAILVNKVVHRIEYGARTIGPRVIVYCCDGSTYSSDYIIVTVPLGVLKTTVHSLFHPELPYSKQTAINKIGFGQSTVVYLLYANPFWSKGNNTRLRIAWPDDPGLLNSWAKGITDIEEVPSEKNILKVTVVGREAEWMEKMDNMDVAAGVTEFLRKFTNDPGIPCPVELVKSSWNTNVHIRGSFSFLGMGTGVAEQCELARPIPGPDCEPDPPVLLFAGEATVPGYHGSLHGARLSGLREADRIIDLTVALEGAPMSLSDKYKPPVFKPCQNVAEGSELKKPPPSESQLTKPPFHTTPDPCAF